MKSLHHCGLPCQTCWKFNMNWSQRQPSGMPQLILLMHSSQSLWQQSAGDSLLLLGGVSSGDNPKSLPSGQSIITSKIPGRLGFPTRARWVISATHLLHVASVAWCLEGTFPLNIQPNTGSRGARSNCASVPTTSEAAWTPSYAANISFSVGV